MPVCSPTSHPCLCVCAESTPVQAAGGAHTPPKKETACVCEEEEGNSQSNEPTNQPSEASNERACVKKKRGKREKRKRKKGLLRNKERATSAQVQSIGPFERQLRWRVRRSCRCRSQWGGACNAKAARAPTSSGWLADTGTRRRHSTSTAKPERERVTSSGPADSHE